MIDDRMSQPAYLAMFSLLNLGRSEMAQEVHLQLVRAKGRLGTHTAESLIDALLDVSDSRIASCQASAVMNLKDARDSVPVGLHPGGGEEPTFIGKLRNQVLNNGAGPCDLLDT